VKKIIITGGHLTPAQAVIAELEKRGGWKIYYLGRKYSLEGKKIASVESVMIPSMGAQFISVPAGRLQRKLSLHTFLSLFRIPLAFVYAFFFLAKTRPGVFLSFGGYVSVPIVVAGWIWRIPILTHEQTTVLGLANKINSFFASKVLVSFPESLRYFPRQKVVLTGNPIRKEIFSSRVSPIASHMSSEKLPLIYITGGNQGAKIINQAVVEILPKLLEKYRVIHQCGKLDYQRLQTPDSRLTARLKKRYLLTDYVGLQDIGWVLNRADLVISRSGANIVSDLAALGKVAILIPIPWTSENEQVKNAALLVKAGTSIVLLQLDLSGQSLLEKVKKVMKNLSKYQANGFKAKRLIKLDAAKMIVNQISYVCAS